MAAKSPSTVWRARTRESMRSRLLVDRKRSFARLVLLTQASHPSVGLLTENGSLLPNLQPRNSAIGSHSFPSRLWKSRRGLTTLGALTKHSPSSPIRVAVCRTAAWAINSSKYIPFHLLEVRHSSLSRLQTVCLDRNGVPTTLDWFFHRGLLKAPI